MSVFGLGRSGEYHTSIAPVARRQTTNLNDCNEIETETKRFKIQPDIASKT
jgi:hypothetical protein